MMCSTREEDYVDNKHRINAELYDALMVANKRKVIEMCQNIPENALHVLTINGDTVLHMATYSKQAELVLKLLDGLPQHHEDGLSRQNLVGNTILHEAAATTLAVPIADKLLKKAPGLLAIRNYNGESALFRAVRYGKADIYQLLSGKLTGYDQNQLQFYLERNDKTTVLHLAVIFHHFDLALTIAREYTHLIGQKDRDGRTCLQLLSCAPAAFKREKDDGFIYSVKLCCSLARQDKVRQKNEKYKSAVQLAKFLVKRDTSWEVSYKPEIHKCGERRETPIEFPTRIVDPIHNVLDTPLILATKSGCLEIVKAILKLYPQAIEHIDDEGRNILHIAIKYRRLNIFELVTEMELPMRRLVRKIDIGGNTILHTVGLKIKDFVPEKIEGPALQLQEELLWFERVKAVSVPQFIYLENNMKLTAENLLETANSELRNKAKEWLKSTSEGSSIVAVFIATVAFAAAYTVPGGPNQSTGVPILVNQPFFVVFTATDVLSLTFAASAVVTFLSILTSLFRFEDFKHRLPLKLMLGFTFLILSVALMMISFSATIILMIHKNENWTKIALYGVSFVPAAIFALSYFPLYASLSRTFKFLLMKTRQALPPCVLIMPRKISSFLKFGRVQSTNSTTSYTA